MAIDIEKQIAELFTKIGDKYDEIGEEAIKAAAEVTKEELIKDTNKLMAQNPEREKRRTGKLAKSIKATKISKDKLTGSYRCKLYFAGYGRTGKNRVSNAQKAIALEHGTTKQKATPFIRPSAERSRKLALEEAKKVVERMLKN